jgi:hypothetical protein
LLLPNSDGISVASQLRVLELAAIETNDSLLGIHVAAEMDLRDDGILFYLAAASTTVAEALEHLARYAGAANEADRRGWYGGSRDCNRAAMLRWCISLNVNKSSPTMVSPVTLADWVSTRATIIFHQPYSMCDARCHCWRGSQRSVNAGKIVEHEIESQCVAVILETL